MTSRKNIPDFWFFMSRQYFITSDFILDIIINNENSTSYFGDVIDDDSLSKKMDSNDANLFFPLMFNFYHGIELILKGIYLIEKGNVVKEHKLDYYISKLEHKDEYRLILAEIKKYTLDLVTQFPELNDWLKLNNFDTNQFYLFLKYPAHSLSDKHEKHVDVFEYGILGNGRKTLKNYQRMRKSIRKIIIETVKIYRTYNNYQEIIN